MPLTLETLALAKYGTLDNFAREVKVDIKKAKRLLDLSYNHKADEITMLVDILDIPPYLVTPLFFGTMFINS